MVSGACQPNSENGWARESGSFLPMWIETWHGKLAQGEVAWSET